MDISFTVLLHYSSIYIYIGALVTFLIDLGLRRMNNPDRFNFGEAFTTTVLWPIVILISIYNLISEENV